MSFSFNVKKVDGALVVDVHEGMLQYIPDGASFTVGGHEPSEQGPTGSLSVSLSIVAEGQPSQYRASAAASFHAPPAATVTLSETEG